MIGERKRTAGERDNQDRSSFDQESLGGAVRAGFQMTENLRETVRYTLRTDEITNVDADASRSASRTASGPPRTTPSLAVPPTI